MRTQLPEHPFWDFSLEVYKGQQVREALLKLQDDYSLNVNLLLFCCWFARNHYGRLWKRDIQRLVNAILPWNRYTVVPLRQLYRRLIERNIPSQYNWLLAELSCAELSAEQVEQLLLKDTLLRVPSKKCTPHQQLSNTIKNILTYYKTYQTDLNEGSQAALLSFLGGIFTQFTVEVLNEQFTSILAQGNFLYPEERQLKLYLL